MGFEFAGTLFSTEQSAVRALAEAILGPDGHDLIEATEEACRAALANHRAEGGSTTIMVDGETWLPSDDVVVGAILDVLTDGLRGYAAIRAAENHGWSLAKFADPTEDARRGITVAEAREIAAEDPSLVCLEVAL